MATQEEAISEDLEGLGGWLILVGIGLVISPVRLLVTVVPLYADIVNDAELWLHLTERPLFLPLFGMEVIGNIVIFIFQVALIFLFFLKKRAFPKIFIYVQLGTLLFTFIDVVLSGIVFPEFPMFNEESMKDIARPLIGSLIWVPYMLRSKRVKATFIR